MGRDTHLHPFAHAFATHLHPLVHTPLNAGGMAKFAEPEVTVYCTPEVVICCEPEVPHVRLVY